MVDWAKSACVHGVRKPERRISIKDYRKSRRASDKVDTSAPRLCHWPCKSRAARPGGLLPIPTLKQVGDGVAEAGEQVLAVQVGARAHKVAPVGGVADLDALGVGIDNPGDLGAAGEKVLEALVDLFAGVARGENFNCQVRCAGEEVSGVAFDAKGLESLAADKRNIGRAAVAIVHPEACAAVEDRPQFVRLGKQT